MADLSSGKGVENCLLIAFAAKDCPEVAAASFEAIPLAVEIQMCLDYFVACFCVYA